MASQRHIGGILALKEGPTFKYLLMHNKDGQWGFIHSEPKPKEGEEQTCVRAIFDATRKTTDGYDLVPGFKNEGIWYEKSEKGAIQNMTTYFLALCRDKEVELGPHLGFRWLPIDTCLRHISKPDQDILLKAHQHLSSKVVRYR